MHTSLMLRPWARNACCVAAVVVLASCTSVLPADPALMPAPREEQRSSAGPVATPVPRTPADSVLVGGWLGRYLIHIAKGRLER